MIPKSNFNAPYLPYSDTFDEEEHVHQLLFKPGSSVYPSDLNQLQTIIQDQISLFGSYFLTPDSIASGGVYRIQYADCFYFVNVNDIELFPGMVLLNKRSGCKIKIIALNSERTGFFYSIVKESQLPQYEQKFIEGELLFSCVPGKETETIQIDRLSRGVYIEFSESSLFLEGTFVYVPEQLEILSLDTVNPTCSIGFVLDKGISQKDPSFNDNAQGAPSFQAPGSDRYRIIAKLTSIPVIEDENFFNVSAKGSFLEYLRLKNGSVIKDVRKSIHSEFEKTLARRTYETSGSYTVKPFKIKIEDYSPTEFIIKISPGKAYVCGKEIDSLSERFVLLPRLKDLTLYRYDKLIIGSSGNFKLIQGSETFNKPEAPKDIPDTMTLYHFIFKPETNSPNMIGVKYENNRRYTMRDIGKLETRIKNMEYYTALTLLEKQTQDQQILDQNGLNRFKNGFMVDNFKTYSGVDFTTKDNSFSFDLEKGILRPSFKMENVKLVFNSQDSLGVVLSGDLITLPFTETVLIEQPHASTMVSVNPYDVFVWEGQIKLYPQNDYWVDTKVKPASTVQHFDENDVWSQMSEEGFNFEWASWDTKILESTGSSNFPEKSTETPSVQVDDDKKDKTSELWNPKVKPDVEKSLLDKYQIWVVSSFTKGFSQPPDGYVEGEPAIYLSKVYQQELSSSILTTSIGSSVKAIELAPYIRGQVIKFEGEGFKPSTRLYAFFGEVDASNWCSMDGKTFGVLKTDENGFVRGYLSLPEQTFTIGSYNFKLTDDRSATGQMTTTFGIVQFYAKGMTQTIQETYISVREPEIVAKLIDSTIEVPDPSLTPTPTRTPTPTLTPTISLSPTITPTISVTPTKTPTPSVTPSEKPYALCGTTSVKGSVPGRGILKFKVGPSIGQVPVNYYIAPTTQFTGPQDLLYVKIFTEDDLTGYSPTKAYIFSNKNSKYNKKTAVKDVYVEFGYVDQTRKDVLTYSVKVNCLTPVGTPAPSLPPPTPSNNAIYKLRVAVGANYDPRCYKLTSPVEDSAKFHYDLIWNNGVSKRIIKSGEDLYINSSQTKKLSIKDDDSHALFWDSTTPDKRDLTSLIRPEPNGFFTIEGYMGENILPFKVKQILLWNVLDASTQTDADIYDKYKNNVVPYNLNKTEHVINEFRDTVALLLLDENECVGEYKTQPLKPFYKIKVAVATRYNPLIYNSVPKTVKEFDCYFDYTLKANAQTIKTDTTVYDKIGNKSASVLHCSELNNFTLFYKTTPDIGTSKILPLTEYTIEGNLKIVNSAAIKIAPKNISIYVWDVDSVDTYTDEDIYNQFLLRKDSKFSSIEKTDPTSTYLSPIKLKQNTDNIIIFVIDEVKAI